MLDPDAETLAPGRQAAGASVAQSACRDPTAQGDLPIRQQGRACRLAGHDRYVCLGLRRAARALLLTEQRGERASAALPRRQAKRRAESAPAPAHAAAPRARGRPRWPEGQHPNPPPKAGKGALRRAHPGSPGPFLFDREIRRSCSRRRRERLGPLHLEGGFMFGNTPLGLCCASGPPHGGRLRVRWTAASVVHRDRS